VTCLATFSRYCVSVQTNQSKRATLTAAATPSFCRPYVIRASRIAQVVDIAQVSLGSSRQVTTRHVRHVRIPRVVTSVSSRACSITVDGEEAVVLACTSLVYCALDLYQSQIQLLEKVRWTCPPQSTLWRRP